MLRTDEKEWYKQFWPWFLIALPTVVIIACLYTVYLAVTHPLSMVKKDYYQEGLTINKNLAGLQKANDLGLHATILRQENRILRIDLRSSASTDLPASPTSSLLTPVILALQFHHPVDDSKDITLLLHKLSDLSFASEQLTEQQWQLMTTEKHWYLRLQPQTQTPEWVLQGETHPDQAASIMLDADSG